MNFSRHFLATVLTAAVVLAMLLTPRSAFAETDIAFPVIFTSPDALAEFGIEIRGAGDVDGQGAMQPFPNKCYNPNGSAIGYRPITISNALVKKYRARGFTLETLCIALVSQARFDPETGARLPTYIFRDDATIDQALEADEEQMANDPTLIPDTFADAQAVRDAIAAFKARNYELLNTKQTEALVLNYNAMTEEQPLAVPACFKNGTAYLDCVWRFDLRTGKPVNEAETKRLRAFGDALDRQMKDAIESGQNIGFEGEGIDEGGYLARRGRVDTLDEGAYEGQPESVRVPRSMLDKDHHLTWYDVSRTLPRGYAVAFFAQQPADPAFSRDALEPKKQSRRVGKERIKKVLDRL